MARQRRGGFKAPELRGTLGTLLRTTREVLERGAREGRSRVEEALAGRRRTDALAELGEIVLDLIRRGEIDIAELPEARDVVAHLDELDAGTDEEAEPPVARAPLRKRFDSRAADADDGTVSAKTWAPPTRKKPVPTNVWRPPGAPASRPPDETTSRERPVRRADTIPGRKRTSGGGITFDDDSDLADYMHPDDVPAKEAKDANDKKKDKKPPEGDS